MKRLIALLAAGALLGSGCESQKPEHREEEVPTHCSDSSCSTGQYCDHDSGECVANEPPSVQLTAPEDGSLVSGDTLKVEGVVSDDLSAFSVVELSVDEGKTWTPLTPGAGGSFAAVLSLPKLDAQSFAVSVRVADDLQQKASAEVSVTVDNVAPKCGVLAPMPGQVFSLASGPTLTAKFTASDGSGAFTEAEIDFGDEGGPRQVTVSEGVASAQWTLPALDAVKRTVKFSAVDASGHPCTASVEVHLDTVAPVLAFAPGQPALVGGTAATHTVTGSVSDGSGAVEVTFDFGDGVGPRPVSMNSGAWGIQLSLPEEDYVTHALTAEATDASGNVATVTSSVIVDRVAPKLVWVAPAAGQKFNLAATPASGMIDVSWSAVDGDPAVKSSVRQIPSTTWAAAPTHQTFVTTQPTDNGRVYEVEVEVVDSVGLTSSGILTFSVDRVAPTISSVSIANQTRLAPRELTIVFSEPVVVAVPDELVIPKSGTGVDLGATQRLTGLPGDTAFTTNLAAGVAVDGYGNPNVAGTNVTFHTEPAIPPSGYTLPVTVDLSGTSDANRFDARADEDGVVSLAILTNGPSGRVVTFGWLNPEHGEWDQLDAQVMVGPAVKDLSIASHRVVNGLAAQRTRGFSLQQAGPLVDLYALRWIDPVSGLARTHSPKPAATALVPVRAGSGDPAGDPVGWVRSDGNFERQPASTGTSYVQNTGIPWPTQVAAVSSGLWHVVGLNGSSLQSTHRFCAPSGFGFVCGFGPVQTLSSSLVHPLKASLAFPGGIGLAVFETVGATRTEACVTTCSNTVCQMPPAPVLTSAPSAQGLRVASAGSGGKVLAARKTSGGIELVEKDVSNGCGTSWTVLGTVPSSTGSQVTEWRPVMFGKKPGVIYLDGSKLKVWVK